MDSSQSLYSEIVSLCADIHRAEYRLLELIERLDALKSWRHEAMPSCAHWLNVHCGLDLVTAREKVRIARALPELGWPRGRNMPASPGASLANGPGAPRGGERSAVAAFVGVVDDPDQVA